MRKIEIDKNIHRDKQKKTKKQKAKRKKVGREINPEKEKRKEERDGGGKMLRVRHAFCQKYFDDENNLGKYENRKKLGQRKPKMLNNSKHPR